jgi:hypothetical protein
MSVGALMSDTYYIADSVIIWLGEAEAGDSVAFGLLHRLDKSICKQRRADYHLQLASLPVLQAHPISEELTALTTLPKSTESRERGRSNKLYSPSLCWLCAAHSPCPGGRQHNVLIGCSPPTQCFLRKVESQRT